MGRSPVRIGTPSSRADKFKFYREYAGPRRVRMFQDGKIICDTCQAEITRYTGAPAEGLPKLHALCSKCFEELRLKS